ncbi:MAG TPA: hypothetical protein VFO10_02835 [Oligoflexus sp.]|uniref:hypothetical protein n=1 Tax=Oligoflexus sp. TaxID=1971216 RepID=UPI002D7F3589|nr:hypothetical protein [Oligoflexus sp.]HET9236158.1 hypothetical protein [Oligoflexus sp.]
MDITSTIGALSGFAGPAKAVYALIKFTYWGAHRFELNRLKALIKTLNKELDDPNAGRKLMLMAYEEKHQENIGKLLNKARRAESVWVTCCLAAVIANYMRQQFLTDDDSMIADALSNLTDQDLEVFVALKQLADEENKAWQSVELPKQIEDRRKSLQQHKDRFDAAKTDEERERCRQDILQSEEGLFELSIKRPTIRVDRPNYSKITLKRNVNLQYVRLRVDRLVKSGALSGDMGGFGGSGMAHGSFVWNQFSDSFYDKVSPFEDYDTRPLKDLGDEGLY